MHLHIHTPIHTHTHIHLQTEREDMLNAIRDQTRAVKLKDIIMNNMI